MTLSGGPRVICCCGTWRITVAEGVEHQEQLDFLGEVGCDQSQGYLHSRPIPRDECATLLQHGNGNGNLILPA